MDCVPWWLLCKLILIAASPSGIFRRSSVFQITCLICMGVVLYLLHTSFLLSWVMTHEIWHVLYYNYRLQTFCPWRHENVVHQHFCLLWISLLQSLWGLPGCMGISGLNPWRVRVLAGPPLLPSDITEWAHTTSHTWFKHSFLPLFIKSLSTT